MRSIYSIGPLHPTTRRDHALFATVVMGLLIFLFVAMQAILGVGEAFATTTTSGGNQWQHNQKPSAAPTKHDTKPTAPCPSKSSTPTPAPSSPTPTVSTSTTPTTSTSSPTKVSITATKSCNTITFTFDLTGKTSFRLVDWNHGLSFPELDIHQPKGHSTYTWHLPTAIRQGITDQVYVWSVGVPTKVLFQTDVPVNCTKPVNTNPAPTGTAPKPVVSSPAPSSSIAPAMQITQTTDAASQDSQPDAASATTTLANTGVPIWQQILFALFPLIGAGSGLTWLANRGRHA